MQYFSERTERVIYLNTHHKISAWCLSETVCVIMEVWVSACVRERERGVGEENLHLFSCTPITPPPPPAFQMALHQTGTHGWLEFFPPCVDTAALGTDVSADGKVVEKRHPRSLNWFDFWVMFSCTILSRGCSYVQTCTKIAIQGDSWIWNRTII